MTHSTWFLIIAFLAIALQGLTLFLAFFEPGLPYRIVRKSPHPLHSEEFCHLISALCDSEIFSYSKVEVLTNGENFYAAELDAIRNAKKSINLEAYIFQKGDIARRFVDALTERARAGVKVNVVLDAVGSFTTRNRYFDELRRAGGNVAWYHPFRWNILPRINNRTHRELIILDGEVGFIGGAGFADHWFRNTRRMRKWRDTMFRVEGEAVTAMQSAFIENWLEASGEVLMGDEYFSFRRVPERSNVMIVESTPSPGGGTRARILFQALLASAQKSMEITTPYFLPDKSIRNELIGAIGRGVDVKIITPGLHSDHLLTRRSSRRLYGELLRAGAKIHEYKPSMIHAKTLVVDGLWCAVGSTNFDHRSFGINDEVNLAARDVVLAGRLREDFARDLAASEPISYDQWRGRPVWERIHESLGWILERQE